MIGKLIRGGFQGLWRITSSAPKLVLFRDRNESFFIGCAVGFTKRNDNRKIVLIYNNYNVGYSHVSEIFDDDDDESLQKYDDFMAEHNYQSAYIKISNEDMCMECYLLPDDFYQKYIDFRNKNKKMFEVIEGKYSIGCNSLSLYLAYIYSEDSRNFFSWAFHLLYNYGVKPWQIKFVLWFNQEYHQLIKNLRLRTITAYNTRAKFYQLMDELQEIRKVKRMNDSINMFNTAQKKMLQTYKDSLDSDLRFVQSLTHFAKLSQAKKRNFIQKVSTISDVSELLEQLNFVTAQKFTWDYNDFMSYIESIERLKYEVIYQQNKVIVIKVLDYETIKYIAKNTNWCISKNKSYWDDYVRPTSVIPATQFMVIDFNEHEDAPLSIIGITVSKDKISAAHDFQNRQLLNTDEIEVQEELQTQFHKNYNQSLLYQILSEKHLNSEMFITSAMQNQTLKREEFLAKLNEYVTQDKITYIKDTNGQLLIEIDCANILKLFECEWIIDDIADSEEDKDSVYFYIFADFRKKCDNLYCVIKRKDFSYSIVINQMGDRCEKNMVDVCISFDLSIEQTMKLSDSTYISIIARLARLCKFNYLRELCKEEKIWNELRNLPKIQASSLLNDLRWTTYSYWTFDAINLIYDNGHYLGEFYDSENITYLLRDIISRATTLPMPLITKRDIDAFYSNKPIHTETEIYSIFLYELLNKIIVNELSHYSASSILFESIKQLMQRCAQVFPSLYFAMIEKKLPELCKTTKK